LIFEITETSALVNVAETESFMRRLTAMGCRFALDDFGAGFTSLSYLKDMPVDIIKIDGGFVRHMDQNPRDQALVRAVTEMAHSMGMKVTAECVENADTLSLLKQLNVDHAQGYFVGRPNTLQFNALREKHLAS
jgi:EAL domain-containing protein (putative c-di-GMP-specific phosphodiesterase class I)